jgi:hypothetical protein
MGVQYQQQCRILSAAPDTGRLRPAVREHAKALHIAVVPLLGAHLRAGGIAPGYVLDPELFVELAGQKPAATQNRVMTAQLGQAPDEAD